MINLAQLDSQFVAPIISYVGRLRTMLRHVRQHATLNNILHIKIQHSLNFCKHHTYKCTLYAIAYRLRVRHTHAHPELNMFETCIHKT